MAESSRNVPSLDLLRGFESAARHLNFTKAADELFLTQSAVSRQIKALEDRLGVRLFVRQRRGLVLTHEGDRLFRAVHGALRQMQDAVESLSDRGDTRRITVTATMGFCSLWLIPRLGEFHRAFPEGRRAHRSQRQGTQPRPRAHRCVGALLPRRSGSKGSDMAVRRNAHAGLLSSADRSIGDSAA